MSNYHRIYSLDNQRVTTLMIALDYARSSAELELAKTDNAESRDHHARRAKRFAEMYAWMENPGHWDVVTVPNQDTHTYVEDYSD